MSRRVRVVTPENILVTYETAGIASRFLAVLTDLLIQIVLLLGVSWIVNALSGAGGGVGSIISAFGIVGAYVVMFAYALIFEAVWNGRTPGKKLFGLRVVRDNGLPITPSASAVRNILRFADFGLIPLTGTAIILFGLPGLLCIFFSPEYRRIGDYAAGTRVIVEAGGNPFGRRTAVITPEVAAMLPCVRNVNRLTTAEYRAVRRFAARRGSLEWTVQAALGERVARPLMTKLEIEVPLMVQMQFADLVEAIELRYTEERGAL